jgi:DNA modification methylase
MTIQNQAYELVAIDRIKPHPRNAKKGNVEVIRASIERNGFYGALVVQRRTGEILVGNHRWKAAKLVGLAEVPVIWVQVDDATERRLLLVDNRSSDLGEYDEEALLGLLKELQADQGLDGTGYTEADLDALIEEAEGDVDLSAPEDEEVIEVPEEPRSVRGEVYQLGPHRLMCGDATAVTDLEKLLDGQLVDLLWTDPPYNVGYEGKTKKKLTIENDAMSAAAFRTFLVEAFSTASTGMRDGACFYIAHADSEGHNFRGAVLEVGWKLSQCLVWVKDQFVMGRQDYHWRHEPILYGWKDGAGHHKLEDRTQDTVWECPRPRRNEEHPTMKPIALVERAIRNSTARGERVLDPFGGSGSTLLAADRAGRVAYLMELDPRYCDVIRARWETHKTKARQAA